MKISTWNVNSLRKRLNSLKIFADKHQPDIIALQETKVENHLFPKKEIEEIGYKYCVYSGQKSYNGVAILSRIPLVKNSHFSLNLYNEDKRHIAVTINLENTKIELHNFYIPAGGDLADIELNSKFKHKLEYISLMQKWFLLNRCQNKDNIIILGDLNIAPHKNDVWSSKSLANVISHTYIERKILIEMKNKLNFIDTARYFTPMENKIYSWWSYRNKDWQKSDRGRRLDHIWISRNLKAYLSSCEFIKEMRQYENPSDHIPYIISIKKYN